MKVRVKHPEEIFEAVIFQTGGADFHDDKNRPCIKIGGGNHIVVKPGDYILTLPDGTKRVRSPKEIEAGYEIIDNKKEPTKAELIEMGAKKGLNLDMSMSRKELIEAIQAAD